MPYYPPADGTPEVPGQMPQASTPGPAPVPYAGADQRPEPPDYAAAPLGPDPGGATAMAVAGYPAGVDPSPLAAPNVSPYEAGAPQPIAFQADADAGGRDVVAGTVAGAVAAQEARIAEMQGDTYGEGSHIGDLMTLPPGPLDPGSSPGEALPTGHYYDPPRNYGDEPQ